MSANERIRVMIVDDHAIVRVGLKQVLEQSGEFEVVGEAADGEEAVRVAADVSPDVVVMDVIMPKKGWRGGVPGRSWSPRPRPAWSC